MATGAGAVARSLDCIPKVTSSLHRDACTYVQRHTHICVHTRACAHTHANIHKQDEETIDSPTSTSGFHVTPDTNKEIHN